MPKAKGADKSGKRPMELHGRYDAIAMPSLPHFVSQTRLLAVASLIGLIVSPLFAEPSLDDEGGGRLEREVVAAYLPAGPAQSTQQFLAEDPVVHPGTVF